MATSTYWLVAGTLALAGSWLGGHAQTPAMPAAASASASAPERPRLPQYLRLQVGTIPTSYWYYNCARLGLEYAPMLTRHLGLAGRLVGVAGHPTGSTPLYGPWIEQVPNQNYRAGFVEAEALLYPLGINHRVRFALGLGGFTGCYQLNGYSSVNLVRNQVQAYTLASYQGHLDGYLASLNLEVGLGARQAWALGLKATRQRGSSGITNLPGYSLTLARRL